MNTAHTYCAAIVALTALSFIGRSGAAQEVSAPSGPGLIAPFTEYDLDGSRGSNGEVTNEISERLRRQEVEIDRLRVQLNDLQKVKVATPPSPGPPDKTASSMNANSASGGYDNQRETLPTPKQDASAAPRGADDYIVMGKGYEVGTDKALTTNWNNGFEAKSKNGDFRFRVGGLLQFDTSFLDTDSDLLTSPAVGGIGSNPDSIQIRRARLAFEGTYYEVFDFKFEFDFANFVAPAAPSAGQPVVSTPGETELWVQWTHVPFLGTIRAGNQKEPLGLEHVESIKFLSFIEPSYLFDMVFGPFNLGFCPGFQVLNCSDDQDWTWQYGLFGNNTDGFGYSINNDWAATARTTYLLWYDEPSQGRYLWDVGMSGSIRTPDEDAVRLRTRGNIRSGPPGVLNPIYADTGNLGSDEQDILAFETFAQYGSWSLQAEYAGTWVQNAEQLSTATGHGSPFFHGGYVELLYFLTGDCRTYNKQIGAPDRVVPLENAYLVKTANGHCAGYGAWQIGFRYSAIDLNDNGINGGILNSGTLGLNWFANPNTIVQFNYDLTHRSEVASTPDGFINGFGTRVAFNF